MYHLNFHTKMIIFNIFNQLTHPIESFGHTVGTPLKANGADAVNLEGLS